MNLIQGQVKDGVFSSENITIKGLKVADGDVTLGFRAEDAAIIDKKIRHRFLHRPMQWSFLGMQPWLPSCQVSRLLR